MPTPANFDTWFLKYNTLLLQSWYLHVIFMTNKNSSYMYNNILTDKSLCPYVRMYVSPYVRNLLPVTHNQPFQLCCLLESRQTDILSTRYPLSPPRRG